MSTVTELYDASERVASSGALPGTMGDYIDGLKDDCGLIIGGIFSIVETLTGYDLLEALLTPIAGDFNTISSMQQGWGEVAAACGAVGQNYEGLRGQVAPTLDGRTADALDSMLHRIAQSHDDQREAAELIGQQMNDMLEVSKATAECVCAALEFIDSVIQEVLADAAVPVLGWAKGAVTAPGKVRRVINLIADGKRAIENLVRAVKAVIRALRILNALLDTANAALDAFNIVIDGMDANSTDQTATAGF